MRRNTAITITAAALELIQAAIDAGMRKTLENLKPSDWLTVYHGTPTGRIFEFINGFDANKEKPRHYNAPRHKGLFVSPDPDLAKRFGSTMMVLELRVKAKNLHGVDYSGNIGRELKKRDQGLEEWTKEKFPNSFRPYLTMTMLQKVEPQGLLRGLVKPNQITRVWMREKSEKPAGSWYTRKELLESGMKLHKWGAGPRDEPREIKDLETDLSYPKYSLDEFFERTAKMGNYTAEKIKDVFMQYIEESADKVDDMMSHFGWEPTARKSYLKKMLKLKKKKAA
jgi:hypothetical protein